MAHDCLLDWVVRRPPPAQTSFNVLLILGNFVLPRMRAVVPGREWREQPDPCVIMLDIVRTHDGVALASLGAAGVVVLLSPPYNSRLYPVRRCVLCGQQLAAPLLRPEEYNAWPMLSINSMLEHISGAMCRGFVKAAVRRYNLYIPVSQHRWCSCESFQKKRTIAQHA